MSKYEWKLKYKEPVNYIKINGWFYFGDARDELEGEELNIGPFCLSVRIDGSWDVFVSEISADEGKCETMERAKMMAINAYNRYVTNLIQQHNKFNKEYHGK